MSSMDTLYLLGGPPRTAKSAIMTGLMARGSIPFIPADAVEHGPRNVFTGMPHQMLRNIEFSGSAEHKASITGGGERKPFSGSGSESELTLQAILGIIDYYGRANSSVAFEGAAITPSWVATLDPPRFTVRAAFVGYTKPSHADNIISYAKENPHDWINEWLETEQGNETTIREWVDAQAVKCRELKAEAEACGYRFFDIAEVPFPEYIQAVQDYLLAI